MVEADPNLVLILESDYDIDQRRFLEVHLCGRREHFLDRRLAECEFRSHPG